MLRLQVGRIDYDGLGLRPYGGRPFHHPAKHADLVPKFPAVAKSLLRTLGSLPVKNWIALRQAPYNGPPTVKPGADSGGWS